MYHITHAHTHMQTHAHVLEPGSCGCMSDGIMGAFAIKFFAEWLS